MCGEQEAGGGSSGPNISHVARPLATVQMIAVHDGLAESEHNPLVCESPDGE